MLTMETDKQQIPFLHRLRVSVYGVCCRDYLVLKMDYSEMLGKLL